MAGAWAEVSLGAIAANVAVLRAVAAPAEVSAVVKANGQATAPRRWRGQRFEAGAAWLAVRPGARGHRAARRRRRRADPAAVEPRPAEVEEALAADMRITVYTRR